MQESQHTQTPTGRAMLRGTFETSPSLSHTHTPAPKFILHCDKVLILKIPP